MTTPRAPWRTLTSLAWRESRSTRRRLLLYMSSITLGVAALVAIDSYAENVTRSVRGQARALLGGDVGLYPRGAFTPAADSLLDSLAQTGIAVAKETSFGSMALLPARGATRLVQVRAVTEGFPLYGDVVTSPAGQWTALHSSRIAIADPAFLQMMGASIGDTIQLGFARFELAATLTSIPGNPGFAAMMGPRVYISNAWVGETRLLTFGSRSDVDAFVRLPAGQNPDTWVKPLRTRLDSVGVRARTVTQREESVTEAIDQLADFLGIVGVIALLLGGVGVASGVHAWIARKIRIVAVMRCLGATSRQVLVIYAAQAAAMGLLGALAGAVLGIGIQFLLPGLLGSYLPVDVSTRLEPRAIAMGVALGVWIALAFALRPLMAIRRISPLQAIRSSTGAAVDKVRGTDWALVLVNLFIVATVIGIAATRSRSPREVAAFSGGIAIVIAVLWASAAALSRVARRSVRLSWPYTVRQGIANLHRPANQTRAVVLSLGFGAFLVSTLYLVQANLLEQFRITEAASRANLIFFDVQEDQAAGVDSIVRATAGITVLERTPIVTMRITAVNGEPVRRAVPRDSVPSDSTQTGERGAEGQNRGERGQEGQPQGERAPGDRGWAARREYRSTYRDTVTASEQLIAGKWLGESRPLPGQPEDEVSLEVGIAADLGVTIGDSITWDVQGAPVTTRVTSLREVNWARFETNFFAVFHPNALKSAPQTFVVLAEATPEAVGPSQRDVVTRYPNVASIDLSLVRKTIGEISDRATTAIRFLTIFSLAMGIPVLFSAVAATRRERIREGVLLKTLGATRRQIGRILLSEYAVLGALGAASGLLLSFGGAWAIMKWVFERPFAPALLPVLGIAAGMVAMAVLIGLLSGRDVFRETAMTALRGEG